MKLGSILNEDLIFEVKGSSRQEIYTNMLEQASNVVNFPVSVDEMVSATMKAENLCMGLEYGPVALPHLRRSDFSDLFIIIGRLESPVKMLADDDKVSDLVIFSLINPTTSDMYLKALSAFTRYVLQDGKVEKLLQTKNGEEFISQLNSDNVMVKRSLTAEDVMTKAAITLSADDDLSAALDILNSSGRRSLPVVDNDGKLVGELDATQMIKSFIPKYLFMLESTDFLVNFEPFERIFQMEHAQKVRDLMMEPTMQIGPEVPLIRITVDLAQYKARLIFITDQSGKLLGEISITNIIHKVLRG